MGDSAYPSSTTCVTPYKFNSTLATPAERRRFNKVATKFRVIVENCICEVKNRFPISATMRVKIRKEEDVIKCSNIIVCCCILHNFILDYDDSSIHASAQVDIPVDQDDSGDIFDGTTGQDRREWVYQKMVANQLLL